MMEKRRVLYRLEVNYYAVDYDGIALETSTPIRTKKEGLAEYIKAIRENCIDKPQQPARVHLWKYSWDKSGKFAPVTICKNY